MSVPQFPRFVFGKNDANDPSGAWFDTSTMPTWEGMPATANVVISEEEPNHADGRPDGTIWIQVEPAA